MRGFFAAAWMLAAMMCLAQTQQPSQSSPSAAAQQQNAPIQPQPKSSKGAPIVAHAADSESASSKAAPFGATLKKTVGFLSVDFQDGAEQGQARGTVFFVLYEDKRLGDNGGFVYMVTNRHMAEPHVNGHSVVVRRVSLRLNLKEARGGVQSAEGELPLGAELKWFFPTDEAVDLAVMPLAPPEAFDYAPFPVSMFATKDVIEKQNIAEGDNVLFAGFFYQYPGQKKIEPIVRQGILAMMPDEDFTTTLNKPGRVYFADAHVFGGNSGSPMFVNVGGFRGGGVIVGGFPYRLLGVVSGMVYETQDFKLKVATTLEGKAAANSGISMIVPADELKLVLDSPELQRLRDTIVARMVPSPH